jgi:hypothetical protein
VNGRFLMAGDTLIRRSFKRPVLVAIFAGYGGVRPIQREYLVVVKVCQPVAAVVTFQAIVAKLLSMFSHPGGVGVVVAGEAIQLFRGKAFDMAITAIQGRAVVILLVARQAELGQPFVVKANDRQLGNVRLPPFVVGVAMLAAAAVRQEAMQSAAAGPLLGHVFVAVFATPGGDAAPGGVALAAILLKFGMGSKAGQRLPAWLGGRQRPWAKWPSAAKVKDGAQNQGQEQSRAAAEGGI